MIVTKIDRLGRSTRELLELIERIGKAGASFRSLGDPLFDTTGAQGRLLATMLAAIAEFERELIRERTGAGRKRAMAEGVKFGRKREAIGLPARRSHQAPCRRRDVGGDRQELRCRSQHDLAAEVAIRWWRYIRAHHRFAIETTPRSIYNRATSRILILLGNRLRLTRAQARERNDAPVTRHSRAPSKLVCFALRHGACVFWSYSQDAAHHSALGVAHGCHLRLFDDGADDHRLRELQSARGTGKTQQALTNPMADYVRAEAWWTKSV